MPRTGKCPNYAGCLLAYRNETVTVPDDAPFVCPECKQPLVAGGAGAGKKPIAIPMIILGGISLLVIMGAIAVYIGVRHIREFQASNQIGTSFENAEVAAEHQEFLPSRNMPPADTPAPDAAAPSATPDAATPNATANPTPNPAPSAAMDAATPNPAAPDTAAPATPTDTGAPADTGTASPATDDTGVQSQTPNLNLQDEQNKAVKDEVLKRIDLMPNITEGDKDKLYMSVERARQMGKILTIPFPSGHVAVSPADVDQLRAALASAQLQPLTQDPTCVFVILGFADMKGDEKTNIKVSLQRANSVLDTLRDRCGIMNVLHAVGMGGSTLFGNEKDAERNRVVEIWAVLP